MSTIGYESWAVDLAEVGAVYPLQGLEIPMTIIGVAFWLVWHRIQFKRESEHLEAAQELGESENVQESVKRY